SSLLAFLLEHGPYLLDSTGNLTYNDFSWNQYANVLYLESPTGVGFSYSTDGSNRFTDDNSTAILNMKALEEFMTRVHPQYATRDFYLTGESYAGVYIPYLSRAILNHTRIGQFSNTNFKGITMGNAAVDNFSGSIAAAVQLYSLGMIPEKHGALIFDLWNLVTKEEKDVLDDDKWDVFYEIFSNSSGKLSEDARYDVPLECNLEEDETKWHITKSSTSVECRVENLTETYLNRDDVQIALHVRTEDRSEVHWKLTSLPVFYLYHKTEDTIPVYREIIDSAQPGFRILFFTGDMDLVCPPLQVAFGARRIAKQNGMSDVTTTAEWRYLGDFGGARTTYQAKNSGVIMDVITVRGAGHLVPTSQPDRAFQIINNFISTEVEMVEYSRTIPRQ
ncbi:hypothetical protein PMAYCL1PPCAC_04673, partial [Pristionchus mayeri]